MTAIEPKECPNCNRLIFIYLDTKYLPVVFPIPEMFPMIAFIHGRGNLFPEGGRWESLGGGLVRNSGGAG